MTHSQFSLDVVGHDGAYEATLKFGDQVVTTFEASSVKNAQRRARTEGALFLAENRPTRFESYSEHFTL